MPQYDRFHKVMSQAGQSWASIEDLIALCDSSPDFWDPVWVASTLDIAKKTVIRKYIRELKDEANMPLWHSLVTVNEDGEETRQYKQEALFDKEDYLQVIQYYIDRTSYNMRMAATLRDRAVKRQYVVQLTLPWE